MDNLDFGKTASDYRKYRAGFPASFFESLNERAYLQGGDVVVDLGTGTGSIARGLTAVGCQVTGIDPSRELLKQAAEIADEACLSVNWVKGTAEATGLTAESVDFVTAGQCWHWFDSYRAITEICRILKPSGRLLIAHFDWLPLRGNVVWHTEQLIKEANPEWKMDGGCGVYPEWYRHLGEGGFSDIESLTYEESIAYTHEAWCGRIRASAGIGGTLSPEAVDAFDIRHRAMLSEDFPDEILQVPHRIFVVSGRK
jgi:ubiquinone/menaquinone biosynthesis C-methylase UbiE